MEWTTGSWTLPGLFGHDGYEQKKVICVPKKGDVRDGFSANFGLSEMECNYCFCSGALE